MAYDLAYNPLVVFCSRKAKGEKYPKKKSVSTYAYHRNPLVVIAVLRRANGKCGSCGDNAPFDHAREGSPYLEVHHVIWLAQGGEDAVENAIAVCPNCHRREHYG